MQPKSPGRPLIPSWFLAMIVASLLISVVGTFREIGPGQQSEIANKDLYDVIWIDSYPEVSSDTWNGYLFSSDNVGISVQAASAYKLTLEVFEFKASGASLGFHFPHDSRRVSSNYSIEKLKKPTKHFDTQLTLTADPQKGGKNSVYFTGPEFRSLASCPESVREALEARGYSDSDNGIVRTR